MRLHFAAVVVVFSFGAALAQEKELISAPTPNLVLTPNHASLTLQQAFARSFEDHRWYWEADGLARLPLGNYRCQRCRNMGSRQRGFSPAKLVWNYDGKHRLFPLLDLTVIKLTPGQPSLIQQKPASEFGTFVSGRMPTNLWNRAGQSLMSVMHR